MSAPSVGGDVDVPPASVDPPSIDASVDVPSVRGDAPLLSASVDRLSGEVGASVPSVGDPSAKARANLHDIWAAIDAEMDCIAAEAPGTPLVEVRDAQEGTLGRLVR